MFAEIIRIIAILCSGLFAGILLGDRMGASFGRPALDVSAFVRFQQIQHKYFERMMPPLMLGCILGAGGWLFSLRGASASLEVWLVGIATASILLGGVLTASINVPINKQLEKWNVAAPPANVREIWMRWEKIHSIRTVLWLGAFVLEAIALTISR